MPKNEFDFEDPLELNGVAFLTSEDTTNAMAECFVEEFLRMGHNPTQVLSLFGNPHYVGPNLALERRGEPFVRDLIADVFARWGRRAPWDAPASDQPAENEPRPSGIPVPGPDHERAPRLEHQPAAPPLMDASRVLTDPMGAPVPQLNL